MPAVLIALLSLPLVAASSGPTPSPLPDASPTVRGAMNMTTQQLKGPKIMSDTLTVAADAGPALISTGIAFAALPSLGACPSNGSGTLQFVRGFGWYSCQGDGGWAQLAFVLPYVDAGPGPYGAAYQENFAMAAQLPPCSLSISGAFDPACVFQCLPYLDGGVNCYDNTGTALGTMTQPSSPVLSYGPFMLPDGGWLQQWEYPDDTGGTGGLAHVSASAIQSLFGAPHTLIYEGYMGSTGPDPTGWFAGAGNNSNQFQLRRGGGSNLQFLETPNIASSGGECIDNWCVIMAKRESDGGINVVQGGNKSTTVATTMTALSGGQTLDLGGYTNNLCCSPSGSQGGVFGSLTGYGPDDAGQAKADSFYPYVNRLAWGAAAMATGPSGNVGNVGLRLARYDLDKPNGGLPVVGVGDWLTDPLTGTVTNPIYHVLGPVDSLDGGQIVGSATWRGHMDKGPLFAWKHQNTAGWLTSEDGGTAGEVIGRMAGDGGILNTNASFIGTALIDGGYAMTNGYFIQNVCGGGVIDGGFDHCNGTVGGAFLRYPQFGCPMTCWGAQAFLSDGGAAILSVLYLGNDAGQTAGLEIAQIQMTDTLELEEPSLTNAQVSAQYMELDAGVFIPSGCNPGKICAVFQSQYSSSWYPKVISGVTPPGDFVYLYDISNSASASTHDMLLWGTVENTARTNDAGNASVMDGLMYGGDSAYITPNKFAQSGQYDGAPVSVTAGLFYVACLEWDVETGQLPDGGTGQGSRLVEMANVCADQAHPYSCQATTVIQANTGQMGLCPGVPDTFEVGTRAGGSGPSSTRAHHINICPCSGSVCAGSCQ